MDHNDFDLEEDIIAPLRLLLDSLVIAKLSEPDDEERKERVETGLIWYYIYNYEFIGSIVLAIQKTIHLAKPQ